MKLRCYKPFPAFATHRAPLLCLPISAHCFDNALSRARLEQVHFVVELHDGVALLALIVVVVGPILPATVIHLTVSAATALLLCGIAAVATCLLALPLALALIALVVVAIIVPIELGQRLVRSIRLVL